MMARVDGGAMGFELGILPTIKADSNVHSSSKKIWLPTGSDFVPHRGSHKILWARNCGFRKSN
jgi:hypothetical protein